MPMPRRALTLSLVAACALSACKEPQPPADFTPEPGQAAMTAGSDPLVDAPVELTYDERRVALVPGLRCNLERVNGTRFEGKPITVSKSGMVRFAGWMADADAKQVPPEFDLRLVNTANQRVWKATARTGGARSDVQTLLGGDAAFAATGYALELDPTQLPDGTYRLYSVLQKDGKAFVCDNGRAVTVGP